MMNINYLEGKDNNIFENKITKLLRSKVLGKFTSIDNRDVSKILIEF